MNETVCQKSHTALWWLFSEMAAVLHGSMIFSAKEVNIYTCHIRDLIVRANQTLSGLVFWGCVSSLCLEDLSQDLGAQQRGERRLLPPHQQRDGGNLLGSPVYTQLCVWWREISLSKQFMIHFYLY